MDKVYKPVPDVEALRYHGTPEKPDIKIFVSHRIDQDSETIDNPLYIPVRCGAVYDQRENVQMLGDDTGDNISEKRNSFCELTVQYWAWKNVEADYYGLCHYRRYQSFSKEVYPISAYGCVERTYPSEQQISTFGLNEKTVRSSVEKYDVILTKKVDVRKLHPNIHSIMDYCKMSSNDFNLKDISTLLEVIKEKYPEYYDYATSYYKSPYSRWYNCYVIKKDIFKQLCTWQFDILFEVEKRLDTTNYSSQKKRELGFFAEHLFGIYFEYLKDHDSNVKIDEHQLVLFKSVEHTPELFPAFRENNVAIALMSSNYYVPYLTVAIQSIVDHSSQQNNYDIIVLHKGIINRNQEIIKQHFAANKNVSIRFYNPTSIVAEGSFHVAATTYSEEAYYRVLVPWIMSHYSKAITLDCDLIAQADLAVLYNTQLSSDEYCGAAIDYVYQGMLNGTVEDQFQYTKKTIGMKNPYKYINTGVMVLNLKSLRQVFTSQYILEYLSSHKFRIQEQDALNALFEHHIKYIDIRWNYYVEVNDFLKNSIKYAPAESEEEYVCAGNEPYIVHYANNPKPWNAPLVRFGECWWLFARKTPYYEEILFRMTMCQVNDIGRATFDIQNRLGLFDNRTGARKVADFFFPKGTKRREILKKIIPKGSRGYAVLKQIYYVFNPKLKRPMHEDIKQNIR